MEVEDGKKQSTNSHSKNRFVDWRFDDQIMRDQMLLGFELSGRRSPLADLLQNCDLPPPIKLFSPVLAEDLMKKASFPSLIEPSSSPPPKFRKTKKDQEDKMGLADHGEESLSLLGALTRSQTRAREAEKAASQQSAKNEEMTRIMLEDSLKLSAYKKWVKLLEIEISMLQKRRSKFREKKGEELRRGVGGGVGPSAASEWWLTLALCISIAGVGFALDFYVLS